MGLGRFLIGSSLTISEVSLIVSSGFFRLWSIVFYYAGNLLRGILFICCNHFLLSPVFCPELGLDLIPLQTLYLFYNLSKCSCCFSHIFKLCCYYSSASVALMVHFLLLCNKIGRARTLYNFILHHHLPPWVRPFDLFRHRRIAIVSWGVHGILFLFS